MRVEQIGDAVLYLGLMLDTTAAITSILCRASVTESGRHSALKGRTATLAGLSILITQCTRTTEIWGNQLGNYGRTIPFLAAALGAYHNLSTTMSAIMFKSTYHLKVFKSVIRPIAILVMYDLARLQRPAQCLFHDDAVFASSTILTPQLRAEYNITMHNGLTALKQRIVLAGPKSFIHPVPPYPHSSTLSRGCQ